VQAISDPAIPRPTFGGFAARAELESREGTWGIRPHHQLHYLESGLLVIELARSQWHLFPGRAAWVSANVRHRMLVKHASELRTVYLPRDAIMGPVPDCATLSQAPLVQEMTRYAMRFGPHEAEGRADRFFAAFVDMARDWLKPAPVYHLPRGRSPELRRGMSWATANLVNASVEGMARGAGVSTRTLTRRFRRETSITAARYIHAARMLAAMQQLGRLPARVSDVATAVGFDSLSAFSHAFREFSGVSPKDYRAAMSARNDR
jgi:AraC-like DNA-binding protein